MCWAEKCCYFIPANVGCVILGVCSFILSTFITVASVACYFIEAKEEREESTKNKIHFVEVLGLTLNMSSVHIILSILILIAVLWMIFSVMLVVGVVKNKPNFVLSYFAYGILVTIICLLSALLVLLQNCWMTAIALFIASLIHIHCLVVVHTVYDQRYNTIRRACDDDDEDLLADCFDDSIDRL